MAGITNQAYRSLCRGFGGGVFVSEMITSRGLVENHPTTWAMVEPDPDAGLRSVQLYGTDPHTVGAAVSLLIEHKMADHIDLNMGCPVPKVTKRGGGAAIPWKKDLFADIVGSALGAARAASARAKRDEVPITVKMRLGLDDEHMTYLEAGATAARLGVAWVALHARTAAAMYSGQADWPAIGRLVEHLAPFGTPVLGNGDIWVAKDAARMVEHTGCAGVVIGRGCLGRPWLFAQLDEAFAPQPVVEHGDQSGVVTDKASDPSLGEVCAIMRRHLGLLIDLYGENKACRDFRKHISWYLKGFRVGAESRHQLGLIETAEQMNLLLSTLDWSELYPIAVATTPRGRVRAGRAVHVPQGWLDSRMLSQCDFDLVRTAELEVSGG